MAKRMLYITYKHQQWTFNSKLDLIPLLDGEDDYVLEFAAVDEDFAIVLKNGKTFKIKDSAEQAQQYIEQIYRNYTIECNTSSSCYISREDPSQRFDTAPQAQRSGCFDYVYVPTNHHFITHHGKLLQAATSYEDAQQKLYKHFGTVYTYIC